MVPPVRQAPARDRRRVPAVRGPSLLPPSSDFGPRVRRAELQLLLGHRNDKPRPGGSVEGRESGEKEKKLLASGTRGGTMAGVLGFIICSEWLLAVVVSSSFYFF